MKKTRTIPTLLNLILALLLISTGLSFAYFSVKFIGVENETTIYSSGGIMKINYDGGANINAPNIKPSNEPFGIKTFTAKGKTSLDEMKYHIILVVEDNTFTDNAIKYKLISENTDNNGYVAPSIPALTGILTGSSEIFLGNALFTDKANDSIHTYTLELYFPETGENQNENQEKEIHARVELRADNYIEGLFLKNALLSFNGGEESIVEAPFNSFIDSSPSHSYSVNEFEHTTPITSNNDKIVGPLYELYEGYFYIYDYEEEPYPQSYSEEHIGWYTCNDSYGLECTELYKINEVSGTTITNATLYVSEIDFDISDSKMFKIEDDYGDSYYFRGDKSHLKNNLIFAEHQWKIIRINGDGSIRIIYNGTCSNNDCDINSTGVETTMGKSNYNNTGSNNKYVGYMYGNQHDTYENTHKNEVSSTIKTFLDNWYLNNIFNKGYHDYVSDTLFCNDRFPHSGTGVGTVNTKYAANSRFDHSTSYPTLRCSRKNDRFTVSDQKIGNGALTYPIGLITADEAVVAGIVLYSYNNGNFLQNELDSTWTMTPYQHLINTENFTIDSYGGLEYEYVTGPIFSDAYVRGVINLKPNTRVTGSGSEEDPYIVNID